MQHEQKTQLAKGKFNTLIISIFLFVILDLGVLFLNFYYSSLIDQDAATINVAGRQRMLSQKITKSLFLVSHTLDSTKDAQPFVKELSTTIELFDTTLGAFQQLRPIAVPGPDGNIVYIHQVDSPPTWLTVSQAQQIWTDYRRQLDQFIHEFNQDRLGEKTHLALESASQAAIQYNLPLLKLMNDLTNQLEKQSNTKVFNLRLIQGIAVLMAFFNFIFILVHYNRQLRQRDDVILEYDAELNHISQLPSMKSSGSRLDDIGEEMLINSKESARRRVSITKALIEELNSKDLVDSLMVWESEFAEREQFSMLEFINRLASRGEWDNYKRKQMHLKLIKALTVDFHHSLV